MSRNGGKVKMKQKKKKIFNCKDFALLSSTKKSPKLRPKQTTTESVPPAIVGPVCDMNRLTNERR